MSDVIRTLDLLRPIFRPRLERLMELVAQDGIPLRVYETVRSPARQEALFFIGRDPSRPEYLRTVTHARPYESAHQFGLGTDLAFFVDGKWTWKEPQWGMWDRMTGLAHAAGLETLSSERPHVQIPGFDLDKHAFARGPGDTEGWLTWVGEQAA